MLLKPGNRLVVCALSCAAWTVSTNVDASVAGVLGFPLRWIGGQLFGGGVDKLKGATDKAIADVDSRLARHEQEIGIKASALLVDAKGKLDDTVLRIDNSLEARILQIKTSADDSVDRALSSADVVLRANLLRAQSIGRGLVSDVGETLHHSLEQLDGVLRDRSADVERIGHDWIAQVDDAAEARIEQLDELAGRRLGNVDVIATKQRIGLEKSALQVVALAGIVAFVVAALKRASQALEALGRTAELKAARGSRRSILLARAIGTALKGPVVVTLAGVALLYGIYEWLPMGAEREAEDLTALHLRQLEESAAQLDYPSARFHASHIQFLAPESAAAAAARAEKVGLLRDLAARPTLIATREALAELEARVDAIQPMLGDRPDPDLLVLRALVRWKLGATRSDELFAASLATRALRLAPRGFALAPLARAYVEVYIDAPLAHECAWSRDSASLEEMRAALNRAVPSSPASPFAIVGELAAKMRRLTHVSNQHYLALVQAHTAAVVNSRQPRNSAAMTAALRARTSEAAAIVAAWQEFDESLSQYPDRLALNVFRLNDAILTRARSFLEVPNALAEPAAIEAIAAQPATLGLRLRLAPPRVAWTRRYRSTLAGPLRPLIEFEETERFRMWERWAMEFERASVALAVAVAGPAEVEARWRTALAASALALYVGPPSGRVPYAGIVGAPLSDSPPDAIVARTPNVPPSLEKVLLQRGPDFI